MKLVIKEEKLREKMQEAITLLCDTVKMTLGPKGRNAIINETNMLPYITNDGVSIAQNIGSDDKVINTILELAKEAAIKTNEIVGDGTTTTLVLLEALYLEGLKKIKEGYNPIILKKEMDEAIKKVVLKIEELSLEITKEDIEDIASISGNDKKIGKILKEVVSLVGTNNIEILETEDDKTYFKHLKGYYIDTMVASPYFFQRKDIKWNKVKVLLINNYLDDLEEISSILNYVIQDNLNLVIIALDYQEEVVEKILSYYLDNINIVLLKWPGYGEEELAIKKDVEAISQGKIVNYLDNVDIDCLGEVANVEINKEQVRLGFDENEKIVKRYKELESKDNRGLVEKEMAMLDKGIGQIYVGGTTTLERREKKMRFEDAMLAIKGAKLKLPGSGITYLQIKDDLKGETKGEEVVKLALDKPIKQILVNAGLNEKEIIEKIRRENFKILYNVNSDSYEKREDTRVLDTREVVIRALVNANSIAGMLLTTSSLIISEEDLKVGTDNIL